jgi:hypothetical protein
MQTLTETYEDVEIKDNKSESSVSTTFDEVNSSSDEISNKESLDSESGITEVIEEKEQRLLDSLQQTLELERNSSNAFDLNEPSRTERIVDYCPDPEQLVTNYRLIGAVGLSVVVILVLSCFCLTLYLQRPRVIVVDRTKDNGDRVVTMDDREYGLTDNVILTSDHPTAGDKIYLVRNFLSLVYGNNPEVRGRKFYRYIKEQQLLTQQTLESWKATWTPQRTTIDPKDPFTVRAIGIQRLTRVVNGSTVEEVHQLDLIVKVSKDKLGREDRNLRTGFQIDMFDWKELSDPSADSSPSNANNTAPGPEISSIHTVTQ